VGAQVYLPQWSILLKANAAALNGITPESLPSLAADQSALGKRFAQISGEKPEDEEAEGLATGVVGSALAILLANRGGKLDAAPGNTISVSLNSHKIEPFGVLKALAGGQPSAGEWRRTCAELGIEGVNLGQLEAPAGV